MWRRYRFTFLLAIAAGAGIGIALYLAVYVTGNPDARNRGGAGAFWFAVGVGAFLGAGTALVASLGSMITLAIGDRRLEKSDQSRKRAGSLGAAVGAAIFWLGFGVLNGLVNPTGWQWFGLTWIFVAVAAPIAALSAAALIGRADKRAQRESRHRGLRQLVQGSIARRRSGTEHLH